MRWSTNEKYKGVTAEIEKDINVWWCRQMMIKKCKQSWVNNNQTPIFTKLVCVFVEGTQKTVGKPVSSCHPLVHLLTKDWQEEEKRRQLSKLSQWTTTDNNRLGGRQGKNKENKHTGTHPRSPPTSLTACRKELSLQPKGRYNNTAYIWPMVIALEHSQSIILH